MASQSLELFFIDGKADGMLTAEVFGWTGHILVTPRTRLNDALRREQSAFTGIYILLSDQDDKPTGWPDGAFMRTVYVCVRVCVRVCECVWNHKRILYMSYDMSFM